MQRTLSVVGVGKYWSVSCSNIGTTNQTRQNIYMSESHASIQVMLAILFSGSQMAVEMLFFELPNDSQYQLAYQTRTTHADILENRWTWNGRNAWGQACELRCKEQETPLAAVQICVVMFQRICTAAGPTS